MKQFNLALSGYSLWFWAILHAGKNIENRSWSTNFRGTFALHTSKVQPLDDYFQARGLIEELNPGIIVPSRDSLVKGAIIGFVDIVGCRKKPDEVLDGDIRLNSKWAFGDYCFILSDPLPLSEPVFCKGAMGFWKIPDEILLQIKERIIEK